MDLQTKCKPEQLLCRDRHLNTIRPSDKAQFFGSSEERLYTQRGGTHRIIGLRFISGTERDPYRAVYAG